MKLPDIITLNMEELRKLDNDINRDDRTEKINNLIILRKIMLDLNLTEKDIRQEVVL